MNAGNDTLTIDKNFAPSTLYFGNAIMEASGQDTVTVNAGVTVTGGICLGGVYGAIPGCYVDNAGLE